MKALLFGCVLTLAFGLAACGPAAQQQAPQAPGPTDAPKHGGVLNTQVVADPIDFDMRYQGKSAPNVASHGLVYNTLLRFKMGPDVDYMSQVLVPELAERWEVAPDAKSFTLYLRKGVKFADIPPVSGREWTSADVKWNLEYYSSTGEYAPELKKLKVPVSQMEFVYEGLSRVEATDRYTVKVYFKDAFVPFVNYIASQWTPIAAREVFERDGSLSNTLIGTGPFVLDTKASQKGTIGVYNRNPSYWDEGKPYLDTIRRLVLPEFATTMAAFRVKQIDMIETTSYNNAQEVQTANPQVGASQDLRPMGRAMWTSQARGGPLADVRVRRAVSLALDRDEFNKVAYGGKSSWALSGAWVGLFTDAETKQMVRYDPEEARRLLAQAGYNSDVTLELLTSDGDLPADALLLQAQLKKVGINFKFLQLPGGPRQARLYPGNYDFYLHGGGGSVEADIDTTLAASFHSASSLNWGQIKDPELDRLLVATRREVDPAKRREALRAAVRYINDLAYHPALVYPVLWSFWHPYVHNYRPHFTFGNYDRYVWLDK